MLIPSAEESYKKGLHAFVEGRRKEALAMFEAAIEIQRRSSGGHPEPRYLSYYGLCLALEKNEIHEALHFCRQAVTLEGYNPDIRCNLGRVLMRAGRRRAAYDTLVQGLGMESDHRVIKAALRHMGVRRPPIIPFLSRNNPLNVFLGRMRRAA